MEEIKSCKYNADNDTIDIVKGRGSKIYHWDGGNDMKHVTGTAEELRQQGEEMQTTKIIMSLPPSP